MLMISSLEPQIIYALGTGIDLTHPTFQGRAEWGFDAISPESNSVGDPHGHGTYVAGDTF